MNYVLNSQTTTCDDNRGSGRLETVCGQCKFFDPSRSTCEARLVRWEYDSSVLVRPIVHSQQATCDRYVEEIPF